MLYLPDAKYAIYWTLTSVVPEIFCYQSFVRVTKLYMLAFVSV